MSNVYALGKHFDGFIATQLASGRDKDADEVVRDGLRLLEDRERKLLSFDAAIRPDMGLGEHFSFGCAYTPRRASLKPRYPG